MCEGSVCTGEGAPCIPGSLSGGSRSDSIADIEGFLDAGVGRPGSG